MHHQGVNHSMFIAKNINPDVIRTAVKKVVESFEKCQSIDPAPSIQERGSLSVMKPGRE